VQFNGLRSVDSGGTITSYAWMFGDGGSASGMAVSHAYAVPGAYNATLTVTDSRGMRASDTATVQVANRPPVANAGADQTQAPGSPVTFNGAGSSDPDGTITAYAWSFGDGASATGSTVTHSYAAAGTYTATLAVTDNRGARGTDTALVTVTASTGSPQTWAKRFGSAGTDVGNGVAVDGSGNVVMTGGVQGATDFGGGVVCPAYSIFVAKYSAAGAPLWCHCFQGMLANSAGRAVAGFYSKRHLHREVLRDGRPYLVETRAQRDRRRLWQWRRGRCERQRGRDWILPPDSGPGRRHADQPVRPGHLRDQVLAQRR